MGGVLAIRVTQRWEPLKDSRDSYAIGVTHKVSHRRHLTSGINIDGCHYSVIRDEGTNPSSALKIIPSDLKNSLFYMFTRNSTTITLIQDARCFT